MHNKGWTRTKQHSNNDTYMQKMNWYTLTQITYTSSSKFQIRCTPLSCQMKWTRWSAHGYQIWVHIFRWNVQIQIYPPVIVRWSEQLGQLVRWSAHRHLIYISWNVNNITYPYKKMNLKLTYLGEHCPKQKFDINQIVSN